MRTSRTCPITGAPIREKKFGRPPEYASPEAQRLAKAIRRTTTAVAAIHGVGMTERRSSSQASGCLGVLRQGCQERQELGVAQVTKPKLFVELCCGSSAVTLKLLGGRYAVPPISYQGSKRGYAHAYAGAYTRIKRSYYYDKRTRGG